MTTKEHSFDLVTELAHDSDIVRSSGGESRVARISALLGPEEGKSFTLGDEAVIGRGPEAGIRIPDRGVSRRHVRLRRLPRGRFGLEDLGSRNGTLVNGKRVSACTLESGDRIQLGPRCLFLFSVHDDLEEALNHAKNVELIGRLSAGVNHDFNNLLCVILANAAYLLDLPAEMRLSHAEVRECLEDMRAAAESGAELTSRLSTLAQATGMAQERVNFSSLCEETVSLLRETFPKPTRIVSHIQPNIIVRGIRPHLRQLVLNPCLNARDAMPDGGTLTFEVVLKEPRELDPAPPLEADAYVVLTIRDTGRGMSPSLSRSAFEPFFTTKDIEIGKGLGLPMVRKVASDCGGTVELESQEGVGTTVRVILPLNEVEDGSGDSAAKHLTLDGSPEGLRAVLASGLGSTLAPAGSPLRRVLLAESDDGLVRAFTRSLRRGGYDVTWVSSPQLAAEEFARRPGDFHLVLLDLDEAAAAEQACAAIRRKDPEVPIVMLSSSSGRSEEPAEEQGFERDTFVHKPIEPAVLARVVQLALRRAGRGSQP